MTKPGEDTLLSSLSSSILSSSKVITNMATYSDPERRDRGLVTKDRLLGVVHVVVVQAIHLKASDPYCKLSLGKDKQRTKTLSNTMNPKWKESLDLSWVESGKDDVLNCALYDRNMAAKDEYLGRLYRQS